LKQKVHQLLSAETECPPKVPIYPHSALKLKSKFGRPLTQTQVVDVQLTATELTRDTSQLQLQQRPVDRWSTTAGRKLQVYNCAARTGLPICRYFYWM